MGNIQYPQIYDVDEEELADDLEALAEGVRSGEVLVRGLACSDSLRADERLKREATVEFLVPDGYQDTLRLDPRVEKSP